MSGTNAKPPPKKLQPPRWRKTIRPVLGARDPLGRYLLKAIPGALVFYLAATPLLLLNPIGQVRRSIREQPVDALAPRALIAFAFSALALGIALSASASAAGALIDGTFGLQHPLALAMQLVAAMLAAVIVGFFFHAALERGVARLGGKSDNASRSNFFVVLFAAVPLQFLGPGAVMLTTRAELPGAGLVPAVVSAVAAAIMLWICHAWARAFGVYRFVSVLLLLSMAAVVAGLAGVAVQALDPAPAGRAAGEAGSGALGSDGSTELQQRRARIERALDRNPGLIHRPGVKGLYQELTAATIRIERAHPVTSSEHPTPREPAAIAAERQRRAAALERGTAELIDRRMPEPAAFPTLRGRSPRRP